MEAESNKLNSINLCAQAVCVWVSVLCEVGAENSPEYDGGQPEILVQIGKKKLSLCTDERYAQ